MLVVLDGKGLESALVKVTRSAGLMVRVPTHAVRDREPLKELADFLVGLGPDHEMPMIGHHGKIENSKCNPIVGLLEHPFKGVVVTLLLEQGQPSH